MAEVLSKDQILLLDTAAVILKDLNIVNALLESLIVLLLERVDVEDEQVSVIAANPSHVIVHSATEKSMAARFLHNNRAQVLVVDMQLVAFAS